MMIQGFLKTIKKTYTDIGKTRMFITFEVPYRSLWKEGQWYNIGTGDALKEDLSVLSVKELGDQIWACVAEIQRRDTLDNAKYKEDPGERDDMPNLPEYRY